MKSLYKQIASCIFALILAGTALTADAATSVTCTGKFMNPITDICWSCMFPLTVGSVPIVGQNQEDIENVGSPICMCGIPPWGKIGISFGFWEPARQVDVTRTPWCFVSLGGISMGDSIIAPVPQVGAGNWEHRASNNTLYQAHWYVNPVLFWLGVLAETSCLEPGGFD